MANDVTSIGEVLQKSQEILVLLPQNPGPDSLASALGLFLVLEAAGKQAHIACATPLDFSQYPLRQTDKISQKIGNKNLVISLQVASRESVDKVSYNLDEASKVFSLIVSPKKGAPPLDASAVSFSLSGARADLIIIIGATGFEDMGSLYAAEPNLFTESTTVAINRQEVSPFATYHLSNPQASSIAEWTTAIIEAQGLALTPDAATNLLAAIDVATNKLQLPSVNATTFESVAKLIRAGGTRIMLLSTPDKTTSAPKAVVSPSKPDEDIVIPENVPEDWLSPPKIMKASKSGQ